MKLTIILSIFAIVTASGLAQGAPRISQAQSDWKEATKQGEAALEKFFKEGSTRYPDDPTFVAKKAQFLWVQAARKNTPDGATIKAGTYSLSTTPSSSGGFQLTPEQLSYDPALVSQAIDVLEEGQKKFPERLDLPILAASFQFVSGNHDDVYQNYVELCQFVKENPELSYTARRKGQRKQDWYQIAKVKPNEALADAMHGNCVLLWNLETREGKEHMRRLAELATAQFPKQPQGWVMLGAYYSANDELDKARELLERSHKDNPNHELMMRNLAWIAEKQEDPETAMAYHQKIIDRTESETERDQARAAMERLKK